MADELFVTGFGLLIGLVFYWAFKNLPREGWQIFMTRPAQSDGNGGWLGENLTYYGFFNACAYTLAVAVFFVLMGAAAAPLSALFVVVILLLAVCMPASRIIARIVEKKRFTFTTAGASFAGIVTAPWIVLLMDRFGEFGQVPSHAMDPMALMAALSIAYAFGEGVGRLGCISFGCCYGKPLSDAPEWMRKLFGRHCFTFSGKTRKVCYAGHLEGKPVIPIQAVTAVLYCGAGLIGIYLFLKGFYFTAFFFSLLVTQVWRVLSEFLRADYRGGGKISAYQIMAGISIFYGLGLVFLFPAHPLSAPRIAEGIRTLWHPAMILFLQLLWIASFLYTGRSKVTGASLSFHVIQERV